MRRILVALVVLLAPLAPAGSPAAIVREVRSGGVVALVGPDEVVLANSLVLRAWEPGAPITTLFALQGPGGQGSFRRGPQPDFTLEIDGVPLGTASMVLEGLDVQPVDGGIQLVWRLLAPAVGRVVRTVTLYDGIAGFESRTTVHPLRPGRLTWYSLDEVPTDLIPAAPTVHEFRAGADWRFDEEWDPPSVGDKHHGDWRLSRSRPEGEPIIANGEWMSLRFPRDERIAIVMERRNYASSVMEYAPGATGQGFGFARATVDLSRDLVYLGPFEEAGHAENPVPHRPQPTHPGARGRLLVPGRALALETAFTIFTPFRDREAWEYHKYLIRHRLAPYRKAVTFNTNGVDDNVISTGAKDDVDFARVRSLAAAARELGVETFILDDGWQARSGDWCPDSPPCPEPRWDGSSTSKFRPRFPDGEFRAVRGELAGDPMDPGDDMALGLWMTPMEFHPSSTAFTTNPQWACAPVGHGTAAVSFVDDGGSNDAGIGVWNPLAMGAHPDSGEPVRLSRYIEDRVRRAIGTYGARYFKFDFLVWVDCLGIEPADMYSYHDEFLAMLDRLQADHPEVTFQIDETNDYRLFPFESVARGPSWFQNGHPRSEQLLHNLWTLAPYVPGFSLGQHAASNDGERRAKGVDAVMAVALGSHMTFWNEIDTSMTAAERAQIRRWTDFYKVWREQLATFTYPLLDDPLRLGWTALQPWDPEAGEGFLLAYRQQAANAKRWIPLRGVGGGTYALTRMDPATGIVTPLGTATAEQLRAGWPVTIAASDGYAIIRIERA